MRYNCFEGVKMKKLTIIIAFMSSSFAYPSCTMCHNGRIAPDLSGMSKKEIIQKLIRMKRGKINPKMAFIKRYSDEEIKKMIETIKK
jgi:cytochrome c553